MFHQIRLKFFLLASLILSLCSCDSSSKGTLRIGVDPTWAPLRFGELQPYVNGYTEETLLAISQYSGISFEKLEANQGDLLEGLERGRYEAILTSLPPYSFHLAKYDFSQNFLDLGPVLIVPLESPVKTPSQLSGKIVGLLANDPAITLVQGVPNIVIRPFSSPPNLLNALVNGELEGALLDRLLAANFVSDLYGDKLKVSSTPLNGAGLHLITMKGKKERLLENFNAAIANLNKKHTLETSQKKWNLQ